jgi:hypothetical protein
MVPARHVVFSRKVNMVNPFGDMVWNPPAGELKEFARRTFRIAACMALLATFLVFWVWPEAVWLQRIRWIVIVLSIIGLAGLFLPVLARPLYWLIQGLTALLTFAISYIFLGLFYYLVLTPVAVWMRRRGRDQLQLRGPKGRSLWVDHQPPECPSRYYRQY